MVQVNEALQFEASLAQHQDQLLRYTTFYSRCSISSKEHP